MAERCIQSVTNPRFLQRPDFNDPKRKGSRTVLGTIDASDACAYELAAKASLQSR